MNLMNSMNMNQNMEQIQNNFLNYKIAKCKNWDKDKTCKYGDKCTFAHEDSELRNKTDNLTYMNQYFPIIPLMVDQSGNPIMMPQGNFSQMPTMMGGPLNQNPFFMGMMPQNTNFPPIYNNNEIQNENNGGINKNQQ